MHPKLISLENQFARSILTKVSAPCLDRRQVELWIKRDDLLHPIVSGNKWRKLKYILNHALSQGAIKIVSMGGAYSNHLHALAYVGHRLGIQTEGFIRGEPQSNPTLSDLRRWGMRLQFVSREDYRNLRQYKHWNSLPGIDTNAYWLPEGGAVDLALQGVAELVSEIDIQYDVVCCPCGTGTTLAGIIEAVRPDVRVIGFSALKGGSFLKRDVEALLTQPRENWDIVTDYHFGGFARTKPELIEFIEQFLYETSVLLEPIYTGKMFYGIYDLIEKGFFPAGRRIVAIHTGGLQGNRGFA
ncbi:1-aminocyclopropane-1-carboxylate deaminase/D-cysteine desulfhydrase [Methylotuvimicrobium alcaliphilum]|uniref:1-aminocyclopropane-1-carboxylate deaminase n=1 Tax=Methylotuvimicrobium alcaliphilum (strain DSM 19304 / NCIMB 14124 / VKM B-2133 / 20Z) TaxID=1091494 RepID=G4SZH0_META2|nr:pyridoxal-phosphate dependent enzyme [Methylotuvimicrobium alcaliphilum]CCE23310.1 1-aminocyclopropane-1-carboxylate deaminase [Methylotuvimicrobium alcaliphilum 20Z]